MEIPAGPAYGSVVKNQNSIAPTATGTIARTSFGRPQKPTNIPVIGIPNSPPKNQPSSVGAEKLRFT